MNVAVDHGTINSNDPSASSIGKAFKSTSKSKTKTELMVFITPKIIRTPEEGKATTRKMIARTSKTHKNVVKSYIELRKMELSALDTNQEIILDRRSKGWQYTFGKKIVDEIVWSVPDNLDVSDLIFEKKGDAPFGFGNSRSIFPAPVRTYLKPSDGVIFKRTFTLDENTNYKSFQIKVASDDAASVYINKKLVDFDNMMKMVQKIV